MSSRRLVHDLITVPISLQFPWIPFNDDLLSWILYFFFGWRWAILPLYLKFIFVEFILLYSTVHCCLWENPQNKSGTPHCLGSNRHLLTSRVVLRRLHMACLIANCKKKKGNPSLLCFDIFFWCSSGLCGFTFIFFIYLISRTPLKVGIVQILVH